MKDPFLDIAIPLAIVFLLALLGLIILVSLTKETDKQEECKPPQHLGDKTEMYLYERDVDGVKVLSLMCIYNERKRK